MTDYTARHIYTSDDANFTEAELSEIRGCTAGLMQAFRNDIPQRLQSSVILSFVISYLLNRSADPAAAWGKLSNVIATGIATATAMKDTKGSA